MHPLSPVNSLALKFYGFIGLPSAMGRDQPNEFTGRWSRAAIYGASCRLAGVSTQLVFSTSSSVREHQSLPPPSSASTSASKLIKVPQMAYGRGRRQWDFNQSKPISFSVNGRLGINMRDALRKHFVGLDGRDNLMLQNAAGAISCRFLVRLFPCFSLRIRADVTSSSPGTRLTSRIR